MIQVGNDCIFVWHHTQIVKRRHKVVTTPFKSPAGGKASNQTAVNHKSKPYKHLEFMTLPSIKRIIDISIDKDGKTQPVVTPITVTMSMHDTVC